MTTEPVCSARQMGFGGATAVAGVLVTSLVAFRALTSYRNWIFVLGCGGSVGAGLLVAKLAAQTSPEPPSVDEPDNSPPPNLPNPEEPDNPVLDPLQLALEGSSDGDVSLDQWLCDQNLRLDEVLARGPRAKVLSIVLSSCSQYCEKEVGLSELHTEAVWLRHQRYRTTNVSETDCTALTSSIQKCLENLWDRDDRILRLIRHNRSSLTYEWLIAPIDHPTEYLKTDGSSFVALMQSIDPSWKRMGGSPRVSLFTDEIFAGWNIIHFPDEAGAFCNTYTHGDGYGGKKFQISGRGEGFITYQPGIRFALLIELLKATRDNEWTKRQHEMATCVEGLWYGLSKRQRWSVVETWGPENYKKVCQLIWHVETPYVEGGERDVYLAGNLAKGCMKDVTNLEQLSWCLGKPNVGYYAGERFVKLVQSDLRSEVISQMNETWSGGSRENRKGLSELLKLLGVEERTRLKSEATQKRSGISDEAVSEGLVGIGRLEDQG